mmetsp:Transcript_39970/g.64841  ORF Transcript_39970/g.64841 Transcript_39970/m.64841 type:complete len:288 (+) Transcript_39970:692-1555(+)
MFLSKWRDFSFSTDRSCSLKFGKYSKASQLSKKSETSVQLSIGTSINVVRLESRLCSLSAEESLSAGSGIEVCPEALTKSFSSAFTTFCISADASAALLVPESRVSKVGISFLTSLSRRLTDIGLGAEDGVGVIDCSTAKAGGRDCTGGVESDVAGADSRNALSKEVGTGRAPSRAGTLKGSTEGIDDGDVLVGVRSGGMKEFNKLHTSWARETTSLEMDKGSEARYERRFSPSFKASETRIDWSPRLWAFSAARDNSLASCPSSSENRGDGSLGDGAADADGDPRR